MHIDSTTDELDAAGALARHQDGEGEPSPDTRRFLTVAHARRRRLPAAALDFFKLLAAQVLMTRGAEIAPRGVSKGAAVSPTGPAAGDVYVSSFTSESVLIINPATNAVAPNTIDIPNGSGLWGWRPAPPAPKPATSTSSTRSPAM